MIWTNRSKTARRESCFHLKKAATAGQHDRKASTDRTIGSLPSDGLQYELKYKGRNRGHQKMKDLQL
jgi:hypothetical protein